MKKNVLGRAAGPRSRFERLSQVYRCLESGSCPGVSAGALASVIFVGADGVSEDDGGDGRVSSVELTYLSLSLLGKITSSLMARSLPSGVAPYFAETLKMLIHEMDLMSHLVRHFQASDQILSHLAVKTVSTFIIYHLRESGVVSPVWEQTCLRAFSLSVPGTELDACLQSLTEALKRLVRGALHGDTGKLLSRFDSSLTVLCSQLLNEDRTGANMRQFGTTLCFLADLLEALTASSLIHAAGSCLQCQKLIQLHSSALLKTTSCSSEDFVKKRLLLLLKRAVLQKAGEEWISGDLCGLKLKHSDTDMTLLAQSVVTAVGADWLEGLQLDVSSFWGSGSINGDASKPDYVGLRAVSLILLKSMEIHIETASRGGEKGLVDITELSGYLQKLWGFLKRHSVQLREERHLCCWISLLFGEQDDDMMEAAKALLSIFLHYRQRSEVNGLALLEDACASGYNPHCLFILLLESISFDHSFLLDLLISAETCFLEYFVQYLKCLLADWRGFAVTCGRTFTAVPHSKIPPASLSSGRPSLACKGEVATCIPAHPPGDYSPLERTSSAPGLQLVNYSSSDESDHENGGPPDEKQTNRIGALDINQRPVRRTHFKTPHSAAAPSQLLESPEKTSDVACETSARVFSCLSELQEVLMRLHMKKLFPYNPAPLLKLLKQVRDSSLQSHELRL